ncbi:MAG: DUF5320 domain-containing protein [Spirochaetales bacterium]|nr:DUF5320 domain-containing protein [Spirochaetales bacterium]
MPRGDRTGPNGLGPMTGRAAGYCAGFPVPGFLNPRGGFGRGFGWFGRGRGRGFRHRYFATGMPGWAVYNANADYTMPADFAGQEAEMLKNQAKIMQENLNALNKRIEELEKIEAEKGE